jgi:hypothetical protein
MSAGRDGLAVPSPASPCAAPGPINPAFLARQMPRTMPVNMLTRPIIPVTAQVISSLSATCLGSTFGLLRNRRKPACYGGEYTLQPFRFSIRAYLPDSCPMPSARPTVGGASAMRAYVFRKQSFNRAGLSELTDTRPCGLR